MSLLSRLLCCGGTRGVKSPMAVDTSKTSPMPFYCEFCQQKFPNKNTLSSHQLNCNRDNPSKKLIKDPSARSRSRLDSMEDEVKSRSMERGNSKKKTNDKVTKSEKSLNESCSPSKSFLDSTVRSDNSGGRSSFRSKTAPGLSPAIEEEINKLVNDLLNKPSKANRERELGFITKYINKKTPAKFLVSEKWIENYTAYLNGSSKKVPETIDNEYLKQMVLTKSLPPNIYLINEIIWRFIHKIYGGGPEIKQCNKSIQLVGGAEYSDHLNETRTADTFSHTDSVRTSLLDTQKSGWLPMTPTTQPIGLANPSFYCYMNSCLQMLLGISELFHYVSHEKYKAALIKDDSRFWSSVTEVVKGHNRFQNYLTPKGLRQLSMKCFDPSEQHDAHEFMRFLLSGMQDEVNLTPPKKEVTFHNPDSAWIYYRQSNISMIDDLLAGQLISTVSCAFCRHVSTAYDPFLDLSFPIIPEKTKTLADCLAAFQSEEELDSYKCEKCKKEGKAKKRLSIQRYPKNLVINLKRFQTYPKKRKLKDQITYPVFDWRINNDHTKETNTYSLMGVIVHDGPIDSGHYVCYSKRGDDWYLCDDETISKVEEAEVGQQQAYVLLYEKREHLGVSKL